MRTITQGQNRPEENQKTMCRGVKTESKTGLKIWIIILYLFIGTQLIYLIAHNSNGI